MEGAMNKARHFLYYPELPAAAATAASAGGYKAASSTGKELLFSVSANQDYPPTFLPRTDSTANLDTAANNTVVGVYTDHTGQTTNTTVGRPLLAKTPQPRRDMDHRLVSSMSLEELTDSSQQGESSSSSIYAAARDSRHALSDRDAPYTRSVRALQKTRDLPTTPENKAQAEDDGLRRSGRKRTQRMVLDFGSQSLPVSSQPTTPTSTTHSSRRNSSRSSRSSSSSIRGPGNSQRNNTARRNQNSNRSTQQRPKRRNTSAPNDTDSSIGSPSEDSIASGLDFEVSIYTEGTAIPHAAAPAPEPMQICFICNKPIHGDIAQVNTHIDQCLANNAEESPNSEANNIAQEEEEEEGPMVAYEWGGQTRIRATAMLEGGVVAAGLGFGSSSAYNDNDDDIDVDEQDETNYGSSQYTDKDLVLSKTPKRKRSKGGHRRQPSGPQYEEYVTADDVAQGFTQQLEAGESSNTPAQQHHPPSDGGDAAAASQLVIDALKERLKEQEQQLQSVQKCLICLEPYDKPCTSINCWHVYCEKCWLHTLGTKKLCPQCLQITQPTDLRRVYL